MKKRVLTKRHAFHYGVPGQPGSITVKAIVKAAQKSVTVDRTVEDVKAGKPGMATQCADAICILREGKKFPHPAFFASVTRSRAYIVDAMKDGLPKSCVVYEHDDGDIVEFDRPGGKVALLKSDHAAKQIKLRPFSWRRHIATHDKQPTGTGKRIKPANLGSAKRLIEAGFLTPKT